MDETGIISEPKPAPAAPPPRLEAAKPPPRRFSGFLAVAMLALLAGALLLGVQWLRTRGLLQQDVAAIARDVAALKSQTEGLDARVAMLEKSSAETQGVGGQLADLNMRLATIEADVLRAGDRDALAQMQARIGKLESASPGEMFRIAAAILARANLIHAAEGAGPFDGELGALRASAPDDPALALLGPIAQSGAPTRTMLIEGFPLAARAALDAERVAGSDASFIARVWASLRGLVRVRRVTDIAGATTQARLARAQGDCDRGDLAGAATEVRGVSGTAASMLEPWLKDADARLALDSAVADMKLRLAPGAGAGPSAAAGARP